MQTAPLAASSLFVPAALARRLFGGARTAAPAAARGVRARTAARPQAAARTQPCPAPGDAVDLAQRVRESGEW